MEGSEHRNDVNRLQLRESHARCSPETTAGVEGRSRSLELGEWQWSGMRNMGSGCIPKMEPTAFAKGSNVGYKEERSQR